MVITVYSDRRSGDVADIALRLAEALSVVVAPHDVVLLGPHSRESVRGVTHAPLEEGSSPADVEALLTALQGQHAAAILPFSGPPTEQVIAAFDASDRVLLVGDPSVASIRGVQRTLKLCQSLGYGPGRTAIILHGFSDDAPLAPADAALALKREIYWNIPGPSAPSADRATAFTGLATRLSESR
ncbi:MAG: hypothetical protein ABIT38_00325 [Gemmatimonadaceae bacterium]